jgi:hypothetical protein
VTAADVFGAGDLDVVFGGAVQTITPWPRAGRKDDPVITPALRASCAN